MLDEGQLMQLGSTQFRQVLLKSLRPPEQFWHTFVEEQMQLVILQTIHMPLLKVKPVMQAVQTLLLEHELQPVLLQLTQEPPTAEKLVMHMVQKLVELQDWQFAVVHWTQVVLRLLKVRLQVTQVAPESEQVWQSGIRQEPLHDPLLSW
jgi:hypothetical protein